MHAHSAGCKLLKLRSHIAAWTSRELTQWQCMSDLGVGDGAGLEGRGQGGQGGQGQGRRRRRHQMRHRLREAGDQAVQRMQGGVLLYSSVECQRIHWKQNGHKAACKKTQARVAAAMAPGTGCAPTHTDGGAAKGASVCIICLDAGDPPPIQSGCGCRGDAGLAHVGCRAEAAAHREQPGNPEGWQTCVTCGHRFTGQMQMGLAETWWGKVKGLDEANEVRQWAGFLLATAFHEDGRYAESETKCRELRAVQQRMAGAHSQMEGVTANLLGNTLQAQNKFSDAEVVYGEALSKQRQELGDEHPYTLATLTSIANMARAQGNFDRALAIFQEVREVEQRVLGAEHLETMSTIMNIASTLGGQSKHREAESLLRELLKVQTRVLGAEHPDTLLTSFNLCAALLEQHKFGEAESRCREVLAGRRRVLGAEHPQTMMTQQMLSYLINAQ